MKVEQILNLIDQDIDKALEEMDPIFLDKSPKYNELSNEYVDQPVGFSLRTFRSRLKRFVNMNLSAFTTVSKNEQKDVNFEELFCKLDFEQQEQHFETIYQNKKVSAFLLHGNNIDQNMDVKWLYHQLLLKRKLLENVPIKIDFSSSVHRDFDDLINTFYQHFEVPDKDQRNLWFKIAKRLDSEPIVALVKYPIKTIDMKNFYSLFYEFFERLSGLIPPALEHSLIFIFIEEKIEQDYKTSMGSYFLWYETEDDGLFSWTAISSKEPKIVNLPPVGRIEASMIRKWIVSNLTIPEVKNNLSCYLPDPAGQSPCRCELLLEDGDSPYRVIKKLYEALKNDNIKKPDQWLKH